MRQLGEEKKTNVLVFLRDELMLKWELFVEFFCLFFFCLFSTKFFSDNNKCVNTPQQTNNNCLGEGQSTINFNKRFQQFNK